MSRLFAAAALLLGALGSATSARAQCGACPFPCSNSGTCVNDVCDCTPGFAGDCCGSLLFCLPPCLSCDQEDGCLQCENGYDLIGGDCVPTFGNCCVSCNCFEVSEQECADMEGIFGTLGNRCANTICFDNVDPEITCPADIELCEEGANTGQSMTSDDCDQDVLVTIVDDLTTCLATPGGDPNQGDPNGKCYGCTEKYIVRTFTAQDDALNSASCSQNIRIGDHRPPVITSPEPLADCYFSAASAEHAAVHSVRAALEDNCDTFPEITAEAQGTCQTTVDAYATDECGLHSAVVQFPTMIDSDPPTGSCNATNTPYVVDEECEAYVNFTGSISDNCCLDADSVSVNVSVTSGAATVEFDYPEDCTVVDNGGDGPTTQVDVTCTIEVSQLTQCPVTLRIELVGTDCCGSPIDPICVDTATIIDTTPPTIACPPSITLDRGDKICDSAVQDWLDSVAATDNCAGEADEFFVEISGLGLPIPNDDLTGVSNTMGLGTAGIISDLDVDLTIDHTFVGDLIVRLEHNGTEVTILNHPNVLNCEASNYDRIVLSDEAAESIQDQCQDDLTSPPSYRPANPLSAFDGMDLAGTWTITVIDDLSGDSGTLEGWSLHARTGVLVVTDAPECGFPFGSTTPVTFTATDACGNTATCLTDITIGPAPRVDVSKKGSLLAFSKVDLRWNASGALTQDTFLTLTNDYPEEVFVQMYFVNGDLETDPVFAGNPPTLIREGEPGCNWVDCQLLLTPDQPIYWSAATGNPAGCQPFAILDPDLGSGPGRPAPDANDGSRALRGYVLAFAVDETGAEIQWNHLSGKATIVDYAGTAAWEYDAFAFQATCGDQGEEVLDCTLFDEQGVCCSAEVIPGALGADGFQYDYAFDTLLLDFFGVGSQALSGPATPTTVDTDLTLHVLSADLRQESEGPVVTKAHFDIWNMNERKLSNTRRCLTCWDQTLLSQYQAPNSFLRENLQTDKGKARIAGLRADECEENCFRDPGGEPLDIEDLIELLGDLFNDTDVVCSDDAALLGLAAKYLSFSGPAGQREVAGSNLAGMGTQSANVLFDVIDPPGSLRMDAYNRVGQSASRNKTIPRSGKRGGGE